MENAIAITRNKQELERLEGIIQKNIGAFYEVGRALIQIRDDELYRDVLGYATFDEYCHERWDFNSSRARQLISATETVDNIKSVTPRNAPSCEFHARPLMALNPDQQRTAWQKAVETAPEGKVTAAHVSKVVREMTEPEKPKPYVLHKPIIEKELVSEDFQLAYDNMIIELKNCRALKWKTTSYKAALEMMKNLVIITEQMGR